MTPLAQSNKYNATRGMSLINNSIEVSESVAEQRQEML